MRRLRRRSGNPGSSVAVEESRWGTWTGAVPVVATHATGFCKEVLRPVVDALRQRNDDGWFIAFDQPAHGDSDAPGPPYPWIEGARHALRLVPDGTRPVGFGHSSGGATLLLAELDAPGTFSELVLVEPIVFPPVPPDAPEPRLVSAALKRQPGFPTAVAATENFAQKPPFAGWAPAALDAYVGHGLLPGPGGYTLKCTPQAEAESYREADRHHAWQRLHEITCPVTIIAGEESDTHPPDALEALAGRLAEEPRIVVVPGASHFVVMQHPEVIAGEVAFSLDRTADR